MTLKMIAIYFNVFFLSVLSNANEQRPTLNFQNNTFCLWQYSTFESAVDFYNSGEYLLSANQFATVKTSSCSEKLHRESLFGFTLTMSKLGEPIEFEKNLNLGLHGPEAERYLILQKINSNQTENTKISEELKLRFARWDQRRSLDEYQNLLTKKPWIAGSLSAILPGAGQAYNQTYQSAALAFILNGIFLSSTLQFAHHNLDAAAVASGLVFSITYFGNILSAVKSANQINQAAVLPFEESLKQEIFPELNFRDVTP